jgi:hypothetical protein
MNSRSNNGHEIHIKACATPAGPCVEASSTNFWEAVLGVAVPLAVVVGVVAVGHALLSPSSQRG